MQINFLFKTLVGCLALLLAHQFVMSQSANKNSTTIYLIPGQGSDARLFQDLSFDTNFTIKHIKYQTPSKKMTMNQLAQALSNQIDTNQPFILIGVSLGGMLATEMTTFLNPQKTIIISSAKNRKELPAQYRFQKTIPIYKLAPKRLAKFGAKVLQPIVEPDRRHNKETFKAMLNDKDPKFLKRTIEIIIRWERLESPKNIEHIHGTKDHTIPYRNVDCIHTINKGSHMMALTRAEEISVLLNQLLRK